MAAAMQMKTRNKADAFDIFVGIRLRQLREKHDESQVVFGKRIGVTFQQIQKYERGINRLSHQHVYELCRQFDIPMTYFTDGFEDGPVITLPFAVPIEPEVNRNAMRITRLLQAIKSPKLERTLLNLLTAISEDDGSEDGK